MEIEVLVDADPVVDSSQKRYRAASAFFTYVSLSQDGKSLPVPQLVVSGPRVTRWAPCRNSHVGPSLAKALAAVLVKREGSPLWAVGVGPHQQGKRPS